MSMQEWEDRMLRDPLASKVSGEHDEHTPKDKEYEFRERVTDGKRYCGCKRCVIIRIKRRRALRFPRRKCDSCGKLHFSLFGRCEECRNQ